MISVCGNRVACLSGWRGDRLFLGGADEPFTAVADLGWDERAQTTPQRRVLLTERACFVLEPEDGLLLRPPYRVRRFARGEETGREVGAGAGEGDLVFFGEREGPGRWRVWRGGIESGRPVVAETVVEAELTGKEARTKCSGTPVRCGETWWYPVNNGGLVEVGPAGARRHAGDPAAAVVLRDTLVCPLVRGRRSGLWIGDRWHRLAAPRLYQHSRGPLASSVVDDTVLWVLRREGGRLPWVAWPGSRPRVTGRALPPGIYTGLVTVEGRHFGFAPGDPPRLVPLTGPETPVT